MGRGSLGALLFGLALLTQALVPVAASRMVDAAGPFGHILVCSSDALPSTDRSDPGDIPSHHEHCQLCQIVVGGWLPPDSRTVSAATLSAEPHLVRWLAAGDQHVVFGADQHRPPRGPPSLS